MSISGSSNAKPAFIRRIGGFDVDLAREFSRINANEAGNLMRQRQRIAAEPVLASPPVD